MAIEDLRVRAQQIDQRESAINAREDALRLELWTLMERAVGSQKALPTGLYERLQTSLAVRNQSIDARAEACSQWGSVLHGLRDHLEDEENQASLSRLRQHLADSLSTGIPDLSPEVLDRLVQTTIAEVTKGRRVSLPNVPVQQEVEAPPAQVPLGEAVEAAVFDDFGVQEFEFTGGGESQPSSPDRGPEGDIDGTFKSFWTLPAIQETDVGADAEQAFANQPEISAEETSFAELDEMNLDIEGLDDDEADDVLAGLPQDEPLATPAAGGFDTLDPFATLPGGMPTAMEEASAVPLSSNGSTGEAPVQEFVDSLVAALAQFEGDPDSPEMPATAAPRPPSAAPGDAAPNRLHDDIAEAEVDAAFEMIESDASERVAAGADEAPSTADGNEVSLIVPSDKPVIADEIEYGAVMAEVEGFSVTEGSAIAHFAALAGDGDPALDPWSVLNISDARGGLALGPLPALASDAAVDGPVTPAEDPGGVALDPVPQPASADEADQDDWDVSLLELSVDEILDDEASPDLERSRADVLAAAAGDDPERRERAALGVKVGLEHGTQFFTGFSKNISTSGIFITTEHPLPIEGRVDLFFELPGGHAVAVIAEVRWRRPGAGIAHEAGVGLEFVNLDHDSEVLIERYVARQALPSPELGFDDD